MTSIGVPQLATCSGSHYPPRAFVIDATSGTNKHEKFPLMPQTCGYIAPLSTRAPSIHRAWYRDDLLATYSTVRRPPTKLDCSGLSVAPIHNDNVGTTWI